MIAYEFLELAAVVIVLYVSELIVYVPPGRVALIASGKRARLLRGLGFLSPLPWSQRYDGDDFHLQYGNESVVAYAPHRIDSRKALGHGAVTVPYEGIVIVDIKDKNVRTNATPLLEAPSVDLAERFKRELDRVRNASAKKRPEVIRGLVEQTLDVKAVAAVVKADKAALYPVRLAATLHALCVITVVAALVLGRVDQWRWLVGALALTWLHAVFRFVRAHKTLRPHARSERIGRALIYLLSPVGVIKAADFISKDRLASFHWLGALRALGTPDQSQDALRAAKRELDHPGNRTWVADEQAAKTAQSEFRAIVSDVLAPLVKAEVLVTSDEGIVVRCPACGAGYTKAVATCFDCGAAIPPA